MFSIAGGRVVAYVVGDEGREIICGGDDCFVEVPLVRRARWGSGFVLGQVFADGIA